MEILLSIQNGCRDKEGSAKLAGERENPAIDKLAGHGKVDAS